MMLRKTLVSAAVVLASSLFAQVPVHVRDASDGAPLPFVRVIALAGDSTQVGAFEADEQGRVTLPPSVAARTVAIRIGALGFGTRTVPLVAGTNTVRIFREKGELDEVVVTGQYGPTRADQAVHKVRVIDAEKLQRLAANDLSDALRNELNIRLSQDNILGTSMSMQGLSGENVKILIDGVPVIGRQDGNIDLAQIDLNGIDRIEVVEGPLSVSYGTNALAGTINLITKRTAASAPNIRLTSYAEQIGRLNLWGTYAKRWGGHNLNINVGRDYFNGWNPGQTGIPSFQPTLADGGRFKQWKPREQYTGRVNYRWNGPKWQLGYKGEYADDRITNRGRPRAPYGLSAFDEVYHTTRFDNAFFADRRWANGRKVSVLAAHDRYLRVRNTWTTDLTTLDEQLVSTSGMQDTSSFTLTNVRAVYASAADSARLRYEFGTDLNYETGTGARIGTGEQLIGDYALYTSVEYSPVEKLVLRPALRYAYNTVYGAPLTPSFNLRWQLKKDLAFRASYARGFRAPSLKELYFMFVDVNHNIQGNLELKAERSHNYAGSFTWNKRRPKGAWRAELGGFYNDISDLITLAQIDATLYSYINIGRYRTTGGTAGISFEGRPWTVTLGGNLTGRNDDLSIGQAEPYLWSHELRLNGAYAWEKYGLTAQFFLKHQGEMNRYTYMADGTVGRSVVDAFNIADASVSKSFWQRRVGVTLGCKNLFDVQNVNTTVGAATGAHSAGSGAVPMMNGRIFFLRLQLEFNGKEK